MARGDDYDLTNAAFLHTWYDIIVITAVILRGREDQFGEPAMVMMPTMSF